ncbi:hypothetical protein ETAA8_04070 [Anatilimnocola aggregata]|uniref:STAS/SEC14 domain-containing protein n=1 Tax=Anatilimnocola aggregata TaxID=2528021 RepID=A0A517Y5E3_9BACT|nr:hypothetical protein [Anatilimnocola aggregata]QDU25342.1 hypothetical protein ETAA8_04070 [Anatilimnocola aggregata]
MDAPEGFSIERNRGIYCPVGTVSFDEVVALVSAAITAACAQQVEELLVDTTGLTGFHSPSTIQRYAAVVKWAESANRRLRLAMVAQQEMIDPQKFGVLVAGNRGLDSNIFATQTEARAWLDASA